MSTILSQTLGFVKYIIADISLDIQSLKIVNAGDTRSQTQLFLGRLEIE
jgi:hypothetical protein